MSLATLLVRRSTWDDRKKLEDLDRAVALVDGALLSPKIDASYRVAALRKLSAMWEERWKRTRADSELQQAWQYLESASRYAGSIENNILLSNGATLRFKIDPNVLKCILEIPMVRLCSVPVSFSSVSRKKFRFIDVRSLATETGLRVLEFDVLPERRYVALSYVWRGSYTETAERPRLGTMSVEGAIGADPISIDVLVAVCKCIIAPRLECDLLWIDGICIIQNDDEDKGWQISNMFDIYKHCKQCLILPGGLSRLVPLTEPTSWIHRAWTLQEAVAPENCMCLFAWDRGDAILQSHFGISIVEVEPGKSARSDLRSLLMMSLRGSVHVLSPPTSSQDGAPHITVKMLADTHEHSQIMTLLGAIDYRGVEGMNNAVWRSPLTRVASRPADAVFSIMGLLNVDLNPLDYDPGDRKTPTIALMKAVLRAGKSAQWLGVAPNMEINPDIPTLPIFPKVGPKGTAIIATAKGDVPISDIMNDAAWWSLDGAPHGEMSDEGTPAIHARSLPICRTQRSSKDLEVRPDGYSLWRDKPLNSDVWYTASTERGPPFALQLGRMEMYSNGALAMARMTQPYLVMLVDSSGPGMVRNMGYANVS